MNRIVPVVLLIGVGTLGAAPTAEGALYSAHCVGWWAWYWDDPWPGLVTVRSESPHNVCGGYSIGCPIVPACAGLVSGQFTAPYGPDRCGVNFFAGPIIITGGVVATSVFTDAEGDVWSIDGAFVGTTCLNHPTRGVFYASETGI